MKEKALNQSLEHVKASNRLALDETAVIQDSHMLKACTLTNGIPISCGRATMWNLIRVYVLMGSYCLFAT